MASNLVTAAVLATMIAMVVVVRASDPELTSDFQVPSGVNASTIDGNFFTFIGLRGFAAPSGTFALSKVTLETFPALSGLGVGAAFLSFSPGSLNPPHTHPRGTELLYVLDGSLDVGLVDTTGKLYTQTLYERDLFVFPKGLVHFQRNSSPDKTASALASFSSSNAGTNALPTIIFGSGISSDVLDEAFKITPDILNTLEAPYKPAA